MPNTYLQHPKDEISNKPNQMPLSNVNTTATQLSFRRMKATHALYARISAPSVGRRWLCRTYVVDNQMHYWLRDEVPLCLVDDLKVRADEITQHLDLAFHLWIRREPRFIATLSAATARSHIYTSCTMTNDTEKMLPFCAFRFGRSCWQFDGQQKYPHLKYFIG